MNPYLIPYAKQEKDTVALLKKIYQTTDMGCTTLDALIGQIEDGKLKDQLRREYSHYQHAQQEARHQLYSYGRLPPEQNKLIKTMAKGDIHRKLLMDHSTSRISEMVMQGASMGIIAIQRAKNQAANATQKSRQIADHLMQQEQAKIEQLKCFL